jgi:hypothetical protein
MRSRAADSAGVRALVAMGAIAVLLAATTVTAGAVAVGPQAVAAKNCKKIRNKAKRKKCKHQQQQQQGGAQDPVAAAIAFLSGKRLSHVGYSQTTGASSTEAFDFCNGGALHFRGDYVGYGGTSWADVGNGTWQVLSAAVGSAQVAITTQSWSSTYFDGSPGPDASPGSGTVGMQLTGANTVSSGGVEYSVSAGPC